MKLVRKIQRKTKSNLLCIIAITLCSCISSNNGKNITKKNNYENVETNSLSNNFLKKLIDTLSVKESDTLLFRKWRGSSNDSVFFNIKTSKFILLRKPYSKYYKTGTNKFSTCELTFKNTKTKEIFNFKTYSNLGKGNNPYSQNKLSSYVDIEIISKNKGKFLISDRNTIEYSLLFELKENQIEINKIKRIPLRTKSIKYWYELDTLITIDKNKNLINLTEIQKFLFNEKNLMK